MGMPLTEHTFVKLEARNFIMLIVAVISIVSSFWIGYGNIMQKLNRIELAQINMELRIDALERLADK